jgi:hypothetical protein
LKPEEKEVFNGSQRNLVGRYLFRRRIETGRV